MDNLRKLLRLDKDKIKNVGDIKKDNLEFYYTDIKTFCCDDDLKPTFEKIKTHDYIEPIKKLSEYFKGTKDNYYEYLLNKYNNYKFEKPFFFSNSDYELDEIMMQYIKCFEKSSIMIVWPIANIENIKTTKFYDELSKNGTVHAVKNISLSRKQVQGCIYQIYYDKSGFKRLDAIKGKARCGRADNKRNNFHIIFYEANNFKELSGKDAPLKVKLRNTLKETSGNEGKPNYYLHVTDNHTHVVELSQLFCNKNSLRMIHYQRLDRISYQERNLTPAHIYMQTYKKWLYKMIHPRDHPRFMIFSSFVLYMLGLRKFNDIDLLIHHLPEISKTKDFFKIIDKYMVNEETKLIFPEATIKGKYGWKEGGKDEYLIEWREKEWPSMYGAKSIDDTYLNPRHHFYYFGLKVIGLKPFLKRRIKRARPAAYADLIAFKELIYYEVNVPPVPIGFWKNHVYYDYTNRKKNELYMKIKWYLRKRYYIDMSLEKIKKVIKFNTIKDAPRGYYNVSLFDNKKRIKV